MKLKQRVVLLAILLVIFIFTKVFLIDNLDTSAANREDQRAFHRMMASLRVELDPRLDHTLQSPWEIAAQWVVPREVYPEETPELGAVMHAMATKKIIKADVGYKGTQLKALLILEGGQKVVFKPKRYARDYVVEGEPYAGYDRHNAEVAAFHLDRILGFRRAPLVIGRFVNLRTEIKPVATEQLLSTFLMLGNSTCFYGKCYYCRETEPACADGDTMEGSVTLWLPDVWPLQKHRHPWGRTYREGKLASVESTGDHDGVPGLQKSSSMDRTGAANVSPSQRLVKIRRRKWRTRDDMFSELQMSSHADRAQQNAWRQSMSDYRKAQYEREERWRAEESKWRAEEDRWCQLADRRQESMLRLLEHQTDMLQHMVELQERQQEQRLPLQPLCNQQPSSRSSIATSPRRPRTRCGGLQPPSHSTPDDCPRIRRLAFNKF
ncbi:glycosaminoglycan xylosylkinase isoform X1 [Chrysemys picta bellii]|uniref:glycosaminoglycan xylosylkinase isoform X1 n=1 Tax=Chrysemys picta bellii TaxID=8478 RepID=UPI0032B2B459